MQLEPGTSYTYNPAKRGLDEPFVSPAKRSAFSCPEGLPDLSQLTVTTRSNSVPIDLSDLSPVTFKLKGDRSPLLGLPVELWWNIFELLPKIFRPTLARVCSTWHQMAWTHIRFQDNPIPGDRPPLVHLLPLLRTLELGARVERAALVPFTECAHLGVLTVWNHRGPLPSLANFTELNKLGLSVGAPDDLREVASLTTLKVLDLAMSKRMHNVLIGAPAVQQSIQGAHLLSICTLTSLIELRTLKVDQISHRFFDRTPPCAPILTNLTKIEIQLHYWISDEDFHQAIRSLHLGIPSLRAIEITASERYYEVYPSWPTNLPPWKWTDEQFQRLLSMGYTYGSRTLFETLLLKIKKSDEPGFEEKLSLCKVEDPNEMMYDSNTQWVPRWFILLNRHLDLVRRWSKNGSVNLQARDEWGRSAIFYVIHFWNSSSFFPAVDYLLETALDINETHPELDHVKSHTPLAYALQRAAPPVIEGLLNRGALLSSVGYSSLNAILATRIFRGDDIFLIHNLYCLLSERGINFNELEEGGINLLDHFIFESFRYEASKGVQPLEFDSLEREAHLVAFFKWTTLQPSPATLQLLIALPTTRQARLLRDILL